MAQKVLSLTTALGCVGLFATCAGLCVTNPVGWNLLRQVNAVFSSSYVPADADPKPFQQDQWLAGKARHRAGMAKYLVDRKVLVGMTRGALVEMLGEPDLDQPGDEGLRWLLGYHAKGLFDESVWLEVTISDQGIVSSTIIGVDWYDPRCQ